ncbi:MAG: amidohydrolase family protein, partial [Chloroflexi bacterium]|nr:amidohydrolase family protein [Chloroflexota bacterium]
MFDWLLVNGAVCVGSGNPWFHADVALQGDRIAAVGRLEGQEARQRLDARGLVVAPGFVDIHTHTDFSVYLDPDLPAKTLQGVTTEVVGQCGHSAAPCPPAAGERVRACLRRLLGHDLPPWRTVADYLAALEAQGAAV